MKTYAELKEAIQAAPASYLPGLLVHIVRACLAQRMLKPGAAARIAATVEEEFTEEQVAAKPEPAT